MESTPIRVRVAGPNDAPLIADMSIRTFYDTFASYNTPENMDQFLRTQFTREQLIAEVGTPRNTFLLAYDGDEPVGYARLYEGRESPREMYGAPSIEISRLYCEKKAIGKGIGRVLMEACLEMGRS